MYYARQIERHAITAWVVYGVKLQVPLSAGARRELGRLRRTAAGLAEVLHAHGMRRRMFEPSTEYDARVLRERSIVRAYAEHNEQVQPWS